MSNDSDKIWKNTNQHQKEHYHMNQYKNEYESTKFVKKYILNLNINNLLDLGCGVCSLCYFLQKEKNINYTGLDICEELLDIARKYNTTNCSFIKEDFKLYNNNKSEFDLVLSNQTLLSIDHNISNNFIAKHFELSSHYVIIYSLFTDNEIVYDINITDNKNNFGLNYNYNIHPVSNIIKIANKYKFNLITNEEFEIKKQIDKPNHKGMGTYTIETKNDKLLQFSDVLHLPWKILIFEKI